MNLRAILSERPSKQKIIGIVQQIGDDANQFDELIQLVLANENVVSQYAAWLLDHCVTKRPFLIQPHLESMINMIKKPKHKKGILRAIVKTLSNADIPDDLQGLALQYCFDLLLDPAPEAAVKVFSMQAVFNISKKEPDLLRELQMVIEEGMEFGSAGYRSRGRRILAEIGKALKNAP